MPGFTGPPFQVREAHVDAEPDQLRADARRLQRGPTEQDQLRAQEELRRQRRGKRKRRGGVDKEDGTPWFNDHMAAEDDGPSDHYSVGDDDSSS